MSDQTDSGQSDAVLPRDFSLADKPSLSDGPKTVVNPESRPTKGKIESSGNGSAGSRPRSSLCARLFPPSPYDNDSPPSPPTGCRIGHFVIDERIGTGGMGAVFRATDEPLQRVVALKVLSPAQSQDAASVQRFQKEAQAAARLDHDNIARVYYIGADEGLHFIAFEYVTGTNVRDLIFQNGRLAPRDAVNYTLQIATALRHASAAGVVHRDVKPSNIIITPSGRAKLVDLGLARQVRSESESELTLAGTTLGTFDYISPEQAKDPRRVDVRSDIYSLGCTLYHMLTGEAPYPEGTVLQKLLDHQGKDPPDPSAKNPRVPHQLSAIVRKMMATRPDDRYQAPDELIRDLAAVARRMNLRAIHPDGLIWASASRLDRRSFWERHIGWMATAATLLLIVFLVDRFPNFGQVRQPDNPAASDSSAETDHASRHADTTVASTDASNSPQRPQEPVPADGTGNEDSGPSDVPVSPDAPNGSGDDSKSESTETAGTPGETETTDAGADAVQAPFNMKLLTESPESRAEADDPKSPDDGQPPKQSPPQDPPEPSDSPSTPEVAETETVKPGAGEDDSTKSESVNAADAGNTDDADSTTRSKPFPADLPELRPFWVISAAGETQAQPKPTLEAAVAAAQDGDVIELRFDGLRPGSPEKPLRVAKKKITIRAGTDADGQRFRPVVKFAAQDNLNGPFETRMMTVTEGAVIELINLGLWITVDDRVDVSADQLWTLASLEGNGQLRLNRVSVTVENPHNRPASVVEVAPAPSLPDMKMKKMQADVPQPEFEVEISECFLRGGCDLFVGSHVQPSRFLIERSVVAVNRSLLHLLGDNDMPAENSVHEVKLSHVTCLVGQQLVRLDSGTDDVPRAMLPVHVSARNNILATNGPGPLVLMTGNTHSDDFRQFLHWNGHQNYYGQFGLFWVIESAQSSGEFEPRDFEGWKREWTRRSTTGEINAQTSGLVWTGGVTPWQDKTFSTLTVDDFQLKKGPEANLDVIRATDGSDVGADLSQLPSLPVREQIQAP